MGCGLKSVKEAETELVGLSRREMAGEGAKKRWAEKARSCTYRRDRRKTDDVQSQEGQEVRGEWAVGLSVLWATLLVH